MNSLGWFILGLVGIGILIGAAGILNWLIKFDIEDDFDQRER
ncbi:hypothetical protein QGP82_31630 [Leptothoe sp. LEGE 181152]|nr:hypothetical protein [Adonisia turfae]MDV3353267.1 hypothetical protein [Leptothoe sp. LEGE 181152]